MRRQYGHDREQRTGRRHTPPTTSPSSRALPGSTRYSTQVQRPDRHATRSHGGAQSGNYNGPRPVNHSEPRASRLRAELEVARPGVRIFCTVSRRPPAARAAASAPRPSLCWRFAPAGPTPVGWREKQKGSRAATVREFQGRDGFDKGTLAMAQIGLMREGQKPARSPDQRTGHRPLSNPPLRQHGALTLKHQKLNGYHAGCRQAVGNNQDGKHHLSRWARCQEQASGQLINIHIRVERIDICNKRAIFRHFRLGYVKPNRQNY
jgi:hypothetical protein